MTLVTGASGLAGSGMVGELLATETDSRFFQLCRTEPVHVCHRTPWIPFDLSTCASLRDLDTLREAQEQTEVIVHAAADIRFSTPLDESRRINRDGTARLLDWAAGCPKLKLFLHVSTVHVLGGGSGTLKEEPLSQRPASFPTPYQQSKFEAEELVYSAMRSLPCAVVRLSTIAGHSETGSCTQSNYLHALLRLIPTYRLPFIPANPNATVDLIASDWTAKSLAFLARQARPGETYHLCAGPERTLPFSLAAERAFQAMGRPVPRIVPSGALERLLESQSDWLSGELLKALAPILPNLAVAQRFENGRTLKVLGPELAPCPVEVLFDQVLANERRQAVALRADARSRTGL
jgi:nucleoside-diphosphate-sugar epimerase